MLDVLNEILASLRLTGGVVLEGAAFGQWCINAQIPNHVIAPIFAGEGQIVAYHYIKRGRVLARLEGAEPIEAGPGSVLIIPSNLPHQVYVGSPDEPREAAQFITGMTEHGAARFRIDGQGEESEFYCGFLGVAGSHHPLLDALPPLMAIHGVSSASDAWMQSNLSFLTVEPQDPQMVARVAAALFAQTIRNYVESMPEGAGGWLAGLKDPVVAKALRVIHRDYADDLQITSIAREVGVSRTIMGERFAATLGEPPMRYVARWRMREAARRLSESDQPIGRIAEAVGFNAEAAFHRAFKREFGQPPAAWRKRKNPRRAEPPGEAMATR